MIKNYFLTTIRILRQNPLYTALSVFGIALTFVFVCILLLIANISKGDFIPPKYAERTWRLSRIHSESVPFARITKEQADMWIPRMTTPEMIVETTNHLEEPVIIDGHGTFLTIIGVSENYFDAMRFKFLRGRPINRQEIADGIPVAVLDKSTANLYFKKGEDPIGKSFEINATQYRVVGVMENLSIFTSNQVGQPPNVIIPLEAVKVFNQSVRRMIWFTAKNKASVADMQAEFSRLLDETNTAEDTPWRITDRRTIDKQNEMIPGLGLLLICLILMLIPALNILSLNVSKSFDRSEEIAIRRAFGAPVSTIFGQLFFENLLLTLAGAIIGMCATPLLLGVLNKAVSNISVMPISFYMHFDWKTILLVAGPCVLVFSFLSGSIPAWITAKREIVNVLKGESQ